MLLIGGYEPIPAEQQYQRFKRELQRFERTWNVRSTISEMSGSADGLVASWRIETRGPNWRVETDYSLLRWDDMVAADFARPDWRRLQWGLSALVDFVVSGTALRYFRTNWRYGVFFAYPFFLLAGFVLLALFAGYEWIRFELAWPALLAPLAGVGVLAALIRWPGRLMYLAYILDDWIFAGELIHRNRPALEARLDRFAKELAARMRETGYDELLFAAHSLGGAMQPEIVSRALRLDPGSAARSLKLLSVGSSLLKIGLHPAARWLREAVARVCANPAIFWIEYQARADIINFFRVDPIAAMDLPQTGKPVVQHARIRAMLKPEYYRTIQTDFFRLHRQLGMANDRRYFYDFFMICCGPVPIERRVRFPDRAVEAFGPDGSYSDLELRAEPVGAAAGGP
jgi:hypothetical protein